MRAAGMRGFLVLWLMVLCAPLGRAAPLARDEAPRLTRQQLIGVWRLVGIEYSGPGGPLVDPFYQTDSTGIIVYDASGWMSVHIVAPHRQAWEVPSSRSSSAVVAQDDRLKAAAFDSYYAYFGTWDFDATTSVVSHHVESSLIPAESGLVYTQQVALENGRMTFTVRSGQTIRKKIWERITAAGQ